MYKIIFIDEQQEDIDSFKDYVDEKNTTEQFEVEILLPVETLEQMIQEIFANNPDAVIVDYMLNDYKELVKYNIPYNGVDVIQGLLSIREDFPCFVMTSFDDDAIKRIEDVNKVYIKEILHGKEKDTTARANFLERVESQITHYKNRIENAEKRLLELIELRRSGKADINDEEELLSLDKFLEHSIDKKSALPDEYRTLSNTDRLNEILTKVDEVLKKIDNSDDEKI